MKGEKTVEAVDLTRAEKDLLITDLKVYAEKVLKIGEAADKVGVSNEANKLKKRLEDLATKLL